MYKWKQFWENVNLPIDKTQKQLKKLDVNKRLKKLKKDFSLSDKTINKIVSIFKGLKNEKDRIEMLYFEKFFRSHNTAIKLYYKLDPEKSINRLLSSFKRKNDHFRDIHWYNLWLKAGKGFNYKLPSLKDKLTKIKKLRKGLFCPYYPKSNKSYHEENRTSFKNILLVVIRKGTKRNSKFMYVGFSIPDEKVYFSPNFNGIERFLVLKRLAKNGLILNLHPKTGEFNRLISFLKNELQDESLLLDLQGLQFEKNGILYYIRESTSKGSPEGKLFYELKNYLPPEFKITNLKMVQLKIPHLCKRKIYKYHINKVDGLIYLNLDSARLTNYEYEEAIDTFKSSFDIAPEEVYLNPYYDEKDFYKKFLETTSSSVRPGVDLPPSALAIYNQLVDLGLMEEPSKNYFGWMCFTEGCPNKSQLFWLTKNAICEECKSNMFKIREQTTYNKNTTGTLKFIQKIARTNGFICEIVTKQVLNKKIKVAKLSNRKEMLTVGLAYNRADLKLFQELCKRCTNLMLLNAGGNLDSINYPIYKIGLGDFVYHSIINSKDKFIEDAFKDQVTRWSEKKDYYANQSVTELKRIHQASKKPGGYEPIDFELNCYHLLNYIFNNAIWLGINESGEKLPDGAAILSLMDSRINGSMIWDCKLSFNKIGANVGNYQKNKRYLKIIGDDKLVKSYGDLKSYLIISNNPYEANFKNTFKKVKHYTKGKYKNVSFLLLDSRDLVKIYEEYRTNQKYFLDNPELLNLISSKMNAFFVSEGIKVIKSEEVDNFVKDLQILVNENGTKRLNEQMFKND